MYICVYVYMYICIYVGRTLSTKKSIMPCAWLHVQYRSAHMSPSQFLLSPSVRPPLTMRVSSLTVWLLAARSSPGTETVKEKCTSRWPVEGTCQGERLTAASALLVVLLVVLLVFDVVAEAAAAVVAVAAVAAAKGGP